MGPITSLGWFWRRENLFLLLGFEPQTIQPTASRYNDYAILAGSAFIFRVKLPNRSIIQHIKNVFSKHLSSESGHQMLFGHYGSPLIFQVIQLSEAAKCSKMGYVCISMFYTGQPVHQLYKNDNNSTDNDITSINSNLLNTVHNWTISIIHAATVVS
jgi:hypothetical protein